MKSICCFVLLCWLSATHIARADDGDADQIKRLIPAATAMSLAEFDRLATSSELPKLTSFKSQPLSLVLLVLKPQAGEAARREFRFVGDGPGGAAKPAALAKEMTRFVRGSGRLRFALGPVTLIHADRITEHQCDVDGDTATGTARFSVPKLIQGRFHYVARKKDGKWRVERFKLPAYEVDIVRADPNTWKLK